MVICERDAKIKLNTENKFVILLRNVLHHELLKIFEVGLIERGQEPCIVIIQLQYREEYEVRCADR